MRRTRMPSMSSKTRWPIPTPSFSSISHEFLIEFTAALRNNDATFQ